MEAKELMIRDWAQSPDLMYPAQYSGRFLDFQSLDGEKYRRLEFLYEDGNCGMHIPENRVNPIEITIPILEKNNFAIVDTPKDGRIVLSRSNGENEQTAYVIIVEFLDGDCHFKIESPIAELNLRFQHYFHELQHALLLVGLNNVADNLKV